MKTTSTKHRPRMTIKKLEEERKLQEKAKNVLIVLIVLALLAIAFYFTIWPIVAEKVIEVVETVLGTIIAFGAIVIAFGGIAFLGYLFTYRHS